MISPIFLVLPRHLYSAKTTRCTDASFNAVLFLYIPAAALSRYP